MKRAGRRENWGVSRSAANQRVRLARAEQYGLLPGAWHATHEMGLDGLRALPAGLSEDTVEASALLDVFGQREGLSMLRHFAESGESQALVRQSLSSNSPAHMGCRSLYTSSDCVRSTPLSLNFACVPIIFSLARFNRTLCYVPGILKRKFPFEDPGDVDANDEGKQKD